MSESEAREIQSLIKRLENRFAVFNDGFSTEDIERQEQAFRIFKAQSAVIQSFFDKRNEQLRLETENNMFPALSLDELGDTELMDSVSLGRMG